MKKELLSPLFTIIAMILIVISRLLDEQKLDWLAYAAVAVIIASGYHMYSTLKKTK
jgi:cytochrome c biogenesis protein CcdA